MVRVVWAAGAEQGQVGGHLQRILRHHPGAPSLSLYRLSDLRGKRHSVHIRRRSKMVATDRSVRLFVSSSDTVDVMCSVRS